MLRVKELWNGRLVFDPPAHYSGFLYCTLLPFLCPSLLSLSHHRSTSSPPPSPPFLLCFPLTASALLSPPHLWLTDSRPPVVMLVKPIKAGNHPLLFRCSAVCTHRAKRVGRVAAGTLTHTHTHTHSRTHTHTYIHTHTHTHTHHQYLSDSYRKCQNLNILLQTSTSV